MAHRGEAQEFLSNLELRADPNMSGLYFNTQIALLITGEGIYEVMTKLPFVIAKFPIKLILNFGIAGSLDKALNLNQVYNVRTAYGFNELTPKFHSFQSSDSLSTVDCITTDQRVLNDEVASKLSPFAHIVDRELWAIGKCAKQFKTPFESYKLISDYAGNQTQCFDLKNKAQEFSQSLLEAYLAIKKSEPKNSISYAAPITMSFSHQKKYQNLMKNLSKKYNLNERQILEKVKIDQFLELDIKPKLKAQKVISALEIFLNPIEDKIHNALNQSFSELKRVGAQVKIDSKLESKKLKLSMEINSQKNIENLIAALEKFEFEKIERIWNGDFNV